MRLILSLAVVVCLLALVPACADDATQAPNSLVDVLKIAGQGNSVTDRDKVVASLTERTEPLSDAETEAVREFVATQEHRDWLFHYLGLRLLRANSKAPAVGDSVDKTEQLLIKLNPTKGDPPGFDLAVTEIAKLSPEVLPLLRDTLRYTAYKDEARHRAAARALTVIGGRDAQVALIDALSNNRGLSVRELLLSLFKLNSDNAAVDEVAGVLVIKNGGDQESAIRTLGTLDVPARVRLRLYSHYDSFKEYGKYAVIRGLCDLATPEATDQLKRIVLSEKGGVLDFAVDRLTELRSFDPCPVFLEAFKQGKTGKSLISGAAVRGCKDAIPFIETAKAATYYYSEVDTPLIATAALARLGKDTEKNSKIVREALAKDERGSYRAAGLLTDEATIELMFGKLKGFEGDGSRRIESGTNVYFIDRNMIIGTLGGMHNPLAARMLIEGLPTIPINEWRQVGTALQRLGEDLGNEGIRQDGIGLESLIGFLSLEYSSMVPDMKSPRIVADKTNAVAFLRKHPALFLDVFREPIERNMAVLARGNQPLTLAREAWTPEATPFLEEIMRTDTRASVYINASGRHYSLRADLAKLLQEKTGKPYTYTDADGTVRKAGEGPQKSEP